MNYADIRKYDTSNWSGINATIFFSGCSFNCPGCFNKDAQDFKYGKEYTKEVEDLFIEYAKDDHVTGVCILGGEPFQQDLWVLYRLISRLKDEVGKPIHMWTGYSFEQLSSSTNINTVRILLSIDTLVDGKFDIDKKDLSLLYRGSSNQRVIDVKATFKNARITQVLL